MRAVLARDEAHFRFMGPIDWGSCYRTGEARSLRERALRLLDANQWRTCVDHFNAELVAHVAEIPSANGRSNARSLAAVGAAIVSGRGEVWEACREAMAAPTLAHDGNMGMLTQMTQGGFGLFSADAARGGQPGWPACVDGFYGWGGFGGSMMIWNPRTRVSVAYTVNGNMKMSPFGLEDARFLRIFRALGLCLAEQGADGAGELVELISGDGKAA